MKKTISIVVWAALFLFAKLQAQTYDITGIKKVRPADISAIVENNEVKGYYAFYPVDKVSKKEYLFNLAI